MSQSPERMSSYRRHFEGPGNQFRRSSPSPTRKETRHRSFNHHGGWKTMGGRFLTTQPRLTSSVSMGTLCVDVFVEQGANLDLDAAAAKNQAFKLTRTSERQEMVVLNDRLAVYIEKVRTLESKNKLLEAEIEALKSSFERTSGLRQLYETQLKELNREAEQMKDQRDLSLTAKEASLAQLDALKSKYNEALAARKQTELEIEVLRPDVDKATAARIKLEKQLENLETELDFMQKVHKEEIEELMQQICSSASKMDLTFDLPDLSSALTQIQSQYDGIAAKNLQEMDTWYRTMFQDMGDTSAKHAQSVRSLREEIAAYRKDILNKERDLESLRTRKEFLEGRVRDVIEKYKEEEEDLQEHVEAAEQDLKLTKQKTALLMREYQELLNAKMAMEIEIATYRKLIEGEDGRLSTTVGKFSLTGGVHTSSGLASPSAPDGSLKCNGASSDTDRTKCAAATDGAGGFLLSSSDENLQQQATETSERKMVLVRTFKTDEGSFVSNTQQRTITVSGAADEEQTI
ncbi:notochord granular surface [Austrofundulus limnaeus]|uniref:Notochord granular surface n=1 Tax=Austrofundulus limnaeus TaxID=52670 RepID=A0A2I4BI20_AUSLI|nr:PREDICTED: glial fibrillary acidic protein-like [Austrofundulus limnaeus]